MFPFSSYCEVFCRNLALPGALGCEAPFEKAFLTQYTHTGFFSGNKKKMLQSPSFMQTLKKAGLLPLRITITRQTPSIPGPGWGEGGSLGFASKARDLFQVVCVCAHWTPTAPALKVVHT